jgi:hypothetical protein
LALVEYSNEGGPGPSYNMQEVPGSTLIMRAVHVYTGPLSWKAIDKETRGVDLPHHQSLPGRAPSSNGNASETKANESFDNGVFFDNEAKQTPSIISKLFLKPSEHIR